jgi:TRAP-type C4-dicarboxylate transport system substrate-binding protein
MVSPLTPLVPEETPMRTFTRYAVVALVLGLILAGSARPAPLQAQTAPRKLDLAHIISPPESGAIGFKYLAEEVTKRSNGGLNVVFHGGTLLSKELEIMDAVKSGNIALGTPVGAACTVFPEMCVFLTPYLVRDYNHAYSMFNGEIGRQLDETFQKKYKVKIIFFYDYGFRHFWNNRKPIATPADLKGLKLRVQQGRVFADTVNGLGASAVPMAWGEVIRPPSRA